MVFFLVVLPFSEPKFGNYKSSTHSMSSFVMEQFGSMLFPDINVVFRTWSSYYISERPDFLGISVLFNCIIIFNAIQCVN